MKLTRLSRFIDEIIRKSKDSLAFRVSKNPVTNQAATGFFDTLTDTS